MNTKEDFLNKAYITRTSILAQLNQKRIKYNWHEADVSILEGVFARGDRRVSMAILSAYKKGCIYDAWTESFDRNKWDEAFLEAGIDMKYYTRRERPLDEPFPWDFIDIGVTKQFMIREWKLAKEEKVTPNCRQKCSGCGARSFGGGVCFEGQN
jgi:hypothetical protein